MIDKDSFSEIQEDAYDVLEYINESERDISPEILPSYPFKLPFEDIIQDMEEDKEFDEEFITQYINYINDVYARVNNINQTNFK